MPALLARFQSVRHVELAVDPAVGRGSCLARTRAQAAGGGASPGGGEIDASIDDQLRRIAELLLPAAPAGEAHP
jgi:flagellar biosynthesis/type III secretory pathway protein FliH